MGKDIAHTVQGMDLLQDGFAALYAAAVAAKPSAQGIRIGRLTLKGIFTNVDFIALPTLRTTPLPIAPNLKIGIREAIMLELQNTVAVNFAGNPAVALPIPLHYDTKVAVTPVQSPASRGSSDRQMHDAKVAVTNLQLIGPWLGEAQLLNAGRLVEAAVKN